jgi:hypothetical protein
MCHFEHSRETSNFSWRPEMIRGRLSIPAGETFASWLSSVRHLIWPHGFLVLVCGYRGCSLWSTSNLHPNGGRSHRRRSRRICCRSDSRIVDPALSCVSLAGGPLESTVECARNFLFRSHRNLRRRGNNRVLSSVSTRWSAIGCSGYFSRRRRHHGDCWHLVFPRSTVVATLSRCRIRDCGIVLAAKVDAATGAVR